MARLGMAIAVALALAGCASTADIDLSKVESRCGQDCAHSYSGCLGHYTAFPIMLQNQCTEALKICTQACPLRADAGKS